MFPRPVARGLKKILQDEGLLLADYGHEHSTYDYFAATNNMLRNGGYISRMRNRRFIVNNPEVLLRHSATPLPGINCGTNFRFPENTKNGDPPGLPSKWHVMSALNELISEDFDQFMENVNSRAPGFVTSLYSMYALNSRATVITLENIHAEMSDFLTRCGIEISEQQLKEKGKENVSPDVRITWNSRYIKADDKKRMRDISEIRLRHARNKLDKYYKILLLWI